MARRSKVELFEEIRREFEFGIGTINGVARKFGVHRRQVRQAIASSVPPDRKTVERSCPTLDPVKPYIEEMLAADKTAHRKQRHTAHRVWVRLCNEVPQHPVAESTVRAWVRKRKHALGLCGRETCIPQDYDFGVEAQVDWYEAYVWLDGVQVKLQIFNMRSMKSGGAFHRAYRHATQQAFFEAHEAAFRYFGGVFQVLRYDNLASAVKKVFRGSERLQHDRFIAFRSHWQFASEFCAPAQPQEKGGVEGEVGYFRRNHLVPEPKASCLEEFNQQLLSACISDRSRQIGDRQAPVGTLQVMERDCLLPLPKETFELVETSWSKVDAKGCIKSRQIWYSTPLSPGTNTQVRTLPSVVEVWHGGKLVASHERSYVRGQEIYNLEHYLNVLNKKPGALPSCRPLTQWRAAGLWPKSLDTLLAQWQDRLGKPEGTRAMVDLILLAPTYGWPALRAAADRAVELGCTDASAVKCLLSQRSKTQDPVKLTAEDLGALASYDYALPVMTAYDQLLEGVA